MVKYGYIFLGLVGVLLTELRKGLSSLFPADDAGLYETALLRWLSWIVNPWVVFYVLGLHPSP